MEKVAEELREQVAFYKVDVDQAPELAQKFGVMSIPTLILFKQGEEKDRIVGALPEAQVKTFASQ
ncbi:hypothetical protein BSNK01_14590 [Bacillaceae bacterium]